MIKKISISNFMGIEQKMSISFLGDSRRSNNKNNMNLNYVKRNGKDVLLTTTLLGENASGKTSFLQGISFLEDLTNGSLYKHAYLSLEGISKNRNEKPARIKKEHVLKSIFENINNESKNFASEIELIDKNKVMKLFISLNKKGLVNEKIEIFSNKEKNEKQINVDLKDFKSNLLNKKFKEINFRSDYSPLNDVLFIQHNIKNKKMFKKWIKIADPKIIDVVFNDKDSIEHFVVISNNQKNKLFPSQLSSGTIKWSNIFCSVYYSLFKKQSFFYIDELCKSFHPSLAKFVIALFSDPNYNKKKSQLLFTTHHPIIINGMRKDAINYIDNQKIVNLGINLKVREDISFSKNYINERLSSHPKKSDMIEFLESINE